MPPDRLEIPTGPDDPEYEEYLFDQDEVERRTIGYRHIVQRLWRATPALAHLDISPAQLAAGMQASDSNSQPCPCGSGLRIAATPWALHREAWGLCAHEGCMHVMEQREAIKAAAGFAGWNMFGYEQQ